jgi:hypothetical protein
MHGCFGSDNDTTYSSELTAEMSKYYNRIKTVIPALTEKIWNFNFHNKKFVHSEERNQRREFHECSGRSVFVIHFHRSHLNVKNNFEARYIINPYVYDLGGQTSTRDHYSQRAIRPGCWSKAQKQAHSHISDMASSFFEERLLEPAEDTFIHDSRVNSRYHGVGRWLLFVFAPE